MADLISSHSLYHGDVVVVAQKAVSKQEGRIIPLQSVKPSNLAEGIASQYGKDSRIVELILSESKTVRMVMNIIVKTHHGYIVQMLVLMK